MTTHPRRRTELTPEQRAAIHTARRLLEPHFPGETVRMYVPARALEHKLQVEQEIASGLAAGLSIRAVASAQGVSVGYVAAVKKRRVGNVVGTFKFPP